MIGIEGMERDTRTLITRAQEGDRTAFDHLIAGHRARIEALIGARLRVHAAGRLDPADVFQEAALRAFTSLKRFHWKGEDSLMPWLGVIVERTILDLCRRAAVRRAAPLPKELAGDAASPSQAMRRHERFERLEDALNALSPDHREVILLARIKGLKVREIAQRMQRSPNAVTQLLWRALEKLKQSFGETETFHLPPRALGSEGEGDEPPGTD